MVSLVGSWVMAFTVLGSINEAVFECESAASPTGSGSAGIGDWLVLASAGVLPVLVMTAAAPAHRRATLIGLAVAVAVLTVAGAYALVGACL